MRPSRLKLLFTCLATLLFFAVLGQAVAEKAEAVFKACTSEHQDGGQDDGSNCPCVCHHHQTAMIAWDASMMYPVGTVSDVADRPQSVSEAPRASIEYPPQLA